MGSSVAPVGGGQIVGGYASGLPLQIPMIDIQEVGTGGGSIARIESGALRVGPESAGSSPGPVCYGLGGTEPTVTDCNLALGRLAQQRGIVGLVMEQMPRPEVGDARHLALGKLRRRDARFAAAAAQRKLGQRRKRRFARSEALDQLVPADRTDVRRADQPDPRQPLGVRHAAPFFAPTRGSVPARSRAIFSRWRHSTITARPARPTA